jgi:hypothetical protein
VSDVPSDPTAQAGGSAGEGGEPSEEEIRAYLGQLRSAPVDQVLAEVSSALVNAAQVKLGRQDARLLLDVVAAVSETVKGRVGDELPKQLDDVLAKLRLAQVEGEREVAAASEQGHEEPDDLAADETSGQAAPPPPSTGGPATGGPGTSRLWTPGR